LRATQVAAWEEDLTDLSGATHIFLGKIDDRISKKLTNQNLENVWSQVQRLAPAEEKRIVFDN
jgi:hypothetical protein